jgi:protease-4
MAKVVVSGLPIVEVNSRFLSLIGLAGEVWVVLARAVMKGSVRVLCLIAAALGCNHPFTIDTQSRVTLDAPIVTQSRIITDTPPISDGGPVVAMPVGSGAGDQKCGRIALVDVDGLLLNTDFTGPYSLGENPVALFREKLDAIAADPQVRAVVIRINSPGGGVTASDILRHDLLAFRARTGLPVVASLADLGTGGAYYLATGADRILANPTTVTGGIGVIINLFNLHEFMNVYNVLPQEVKSGENIDLGTPIRKMTDEQRAMLQGLADQFHARFQQVVQQARPGLDLAGGTTMDGRVFTAPQALERHLIDGIGYLDDAIHLARELAQAPQACPVLFHRANDPAHSIHAVSPNVPLQANLLGISLPGLDRTRLPSFLYLWQPEATLERLSGK